MRIRRLAAIANRSVLGSAVVLLLAMAIAEDGWARTQGDEESVPRRMAPPTVLPIPYDPADHVPTAARVALTFRSPTGPPEGLRRQISRMAELSTGERRQAASRYASWLADRFSPVLPKAPRDRLRRLYEQFLGKGAEVASQARDGPAPIERTDETRRVVASAMATLLLGERRVLASYPEAQRARYGRILVQPGSPEPSRGDIERELLRFVDGSRLHAAISVGPTDTRRDAVYELVRDEREGTFRLVEKTSRPHGPMEKWSEFLQDTCTTVGSQVSSQVVSRSAVAWKGYGFVAEHPVTGPQWEAWGLPTLYHTSILVGRWYLEKAAERVTTRLCRSLGVAPVYMQSSRSVYTWRFYDWALANACAGTYQSGDTLRPFLELTPAADADDPAEDVARQIWGAQEDDTGKCCTARYGAYPVGVYGITWVCHQACNAFAHAKWGVDPVFYPVSAIFGVLGSLGTGDVTDPCQCELGGTNQCCVAGHGDCCWFNTAFGQAAAWGANLATGWDPEHGWFNTGCRYNQEDPARHVPGWDSPPLVIEP
jgi:hypothetical protein